MTHNELRELVDKVKKHRFETQVLEVKSAAQGCPKVYDTYSSFSNQSDGGIILFGIDESSDYATVGVYNPQKLQKELGHMALEMEPVVRPIFTVIEENEGVFIVAAEIPPMDVSDRPCFKKTAGRLKGSYVRVGDSDQRMTEYEIYAYEAFRKRIRDDIQTIDIQNLDLLNNYILDDYLRRSTVNRPNLATIEKEQLFEMVGITRNGDLTLAALLLFGFYPQGLYPQLSVAACRIPGIEMGDVTENGSRFLSSKRMDGTLMEIVDASVSFVQANMNIAIGVSSTTGKRFDIPEYPIEAVREVILNALIHRDYSFYTQSMPVQLRMFADRLEVHSPGGLYGRTRIEELGRERQPETRNPAIVTAMETMGYTENRYSGIPRVRRLMQEAGLPQPVFRNERGEFIACLYNGKSVQNTPVHSSDDTEEPRFGTPDELLTFCAKPRTRREIAQFLGINSQSYAIQRYVAPLVEGGLITLTIPEKPRSSRQQYVTSRNGRGTA